MKRLIDSIRRTRSGFRRFDPDGDPGPDVELEGRSIVLFYLFPALGDAVLLAPVVKALIERGAKTPIGLVLRKNAARIWKYVDLPVRIIPYPDELVLPVNDPRWRSKELAEEIEKLEKKISKYAIAADLTRRGEVDCHRFVAGSGAEVRLGFVDPRQPAADLTWGTPDTRVQGERHWSKYLVLPLRCLGITEPSYDIDFSIDARAEREAAELWGPRPRVVLVPGAMSEEKRWGEERFVGVGRWVIEERKGSVVVCGAPSEAKLCRAVVKKIGAGAVPYTQKNLELLLSLIRGADAVITNDTGPMHFAFMLNVPTVAVFTYMSPVCWGPPKKDPRFVVLRSPGNDVEDPEGVWTRAVIHYLGGLLDRSEVK
jgi:ADP-heptose:LPS heptosyltransferase